MNSSSSWQLHMMQKDTASAFDVQRLHRSVMQLKHSFKLQMRTSTACKGGFKIRLNVS
jgi:hypothetical protein